MFLKLALIFYSIVFIIASDLDDQSIENTNSSESIDENATEKSNGTGKTYFIQLRKNNSSQEQTFEFVNHYNSPLNDEISSNNEDVVDKDDNLSAFINKPATMEIEPQMTNLNKNVKDATENFLDDEWSFQINSNFEFPKISQEIYDAMLENNKHNTMKNASTVRCLFELLNGQYDNSDVLLFDTSHLQMRNNEILVEAELYIYTTKNETFSFDKSKQGSEHILRLYQILDINRTDYTNGSYTPDLHKLVNVVYIPAGYVGWQVFKVRGVIENWLNGGDNLGVLIAARDGSDHILDLNIVHRENNGGQYQPTLILYFEKKDKSCHVDEVAEQRNERTLLPRNKQSRPTAVSQRHLRLLRHGAVPCSRHVWYVSFHQLGWNNFILSPHGFMAYRCLGQCVPVPFSAPYTNHAKLESGFGGGDGRRAARAPCCVPRRYKSLVLMFYDRQQNVVIKRYDDMIADECGCR